MTTTLLTGLFALAISAPAEPFEPQIDAILSVGPMAAGQEDAQEAVQALAAGGADALVPILSAIGRGDRLADNWLRGAFEAALARLDSVPLDRLAAFFKNRGNDGRARRLAYETILARDADLAATLSEGSLDDPSPEMRRDAVDEIVRRAEAEGADRVALLTQALDAATDRTQIKDISGKLTAAGEEVDTSARYGFIRGWQLVGPFDNRDEAGFDVPVGPETGDPATPDTTASYPTDNPEFEGDVSWTPARTDADDGVVDIAEQLGPYKGATVYMAATVMSEDARPVELRLSTPNAWKLWLNGELLFARGEYHRGMHWDQYAVPARLRSGENTLLLKVLQNEQTQQWAQDYKMSVRVLDPAGRPVTLPQP